ncbi:MAG: hypothetical protein AB1696_22765 [Planctomycetota bacterium]
MATETYLFAAGLCLLAAHGLGLASAGAADPQMVVSVQAADDATLTRVAAMGASALFLPPDPAAATQQAVAQTCAQAKKHNLKVWVGVSFPGTVPQLPEGQIEGVALIFAPPIGEPIPNTDLKALLIRKQNGDALADAIRRIKKDLGKSVKLAICTDATEVAPETSRTSYVPVADLVRDGTVDVVCLTGADGFNFHRLCLLRDAPLQAGMALDGRATDEKTAGSIIGRAILAALKNESCERLWFINLPVELVVHVVPATINGYHKTVSEQDAIQSAIEKGELVIDQEVDPAKCNDQATIHGVGQSFMPSRDGLCPMIQICAALRGCKGQLPPPLKVDLRMNDRNMPDGASIAQATIAANAFGHEPTYRWVNAYFNPPVPLKKGQKYWLYLPNAQHPEGSYVWRIIKDGATPRGNAWSERYKYTDHTWVFRVYLKRQ